MDKIRKDNKFRIEMMKNNNRSTHMIESSFVISNKDRGESSQYNENSIDSKINGLEIIDVDNIPDNNDSDDDSVESNIVDLEDVSIKPHMNVNRPKTIMKLLQSDAPFCISPRSNATRAFEMPGSKAIATPKAGNSIKLHRRVKSIN